MGLLDDLSTMAGPLFKGAREVAMVGVDRVGQWAEERATERRMRDIDERLEKAAAEAKAAGKDGTHADHGFPEKDEEDGLAQFHKPPEAATDGEGDGEDAGDNPWQGEAPKGPHNPAHEGKAINFDPFDVVSLMGYREKPTDLSFKAMERVATQVPVVTDIIRTRIKQVQTFCQLPEDRHSPGFEVRLRDRSLTPTPESDQLCRELEQVILNCGYTDPANPQDGVPLHRFAAMFLRDSLGYDQGVFEVIPDRAGRPSHFRVVDGTTIRLVDPVVAEQEGLFAIQLIEGIVVADFTSDELAFCTRNPRSGIRTYGYGESEVETLVREITGFLWGIEYNRRFFSQGSATKGILNFKGAIPDTQMKAFRRQWYAMISGVANAWRTPIVNAEDLQWINLQMSNRDMEYSAWIDFLIKVCCARFAIAPEEVNFSYGNTGQASAMGNTSIEEKLKASRDLGLRPLVKWFFEQINRHFLQRIHPDFDVIPVGLDEKGAEAEVDLLQKQTHVFMTVDEARQEVGMEPLPDGKGDVILDPSWIQCAQAKEMGGEGGLPGEDGGLPGEDGQPPGGDQQPPGEGDNPEDVDWGITDENGEPLDTGDEGGDNAGVAKSARPAIDSLASRRVVRYETPIG